MDLNRLFRGKAVSQAGEEPDYDGGEKAKQHDHDRCLQASITNVAASREYADEG